MVDKILTVPVSASQPLFPWEDIPEEIVGVLVGMLSNHSFVTLVHEQSERHVFGFSLMHPATNRGARVIYDNPEIHPVVDFGAASFETIHAIVSSLQAPKDSDKVAVSIGWTAGDDSTAMLRYAEGLLKQFTARLGNTATVISEATAQVFNPFVTGYALAGAAMMRSALCMSSEVWQPRIDDEADELLRRLGG